MYYVGSFKNGIKSIYANPFKTLEAVVKHCDGYGSYYTDVFEGESTMNNKFYCSVKEIKRIVKLKDL